MSYAIKIVLVMAATFSWSAAYGDQPLLLVQGGLNALLATQQTFSIDVSDEVKDNCLPQPSKLKDEMEISLRKNGFGITKKNLFSNNITISALGYGTSSGSCAISIQALLSFLINTTVPYAQDMKGDSTTITTYWYGFNGTLLTGSKADMQSRLEKWARNAGDQIYLDISRARDDIFKKFPAIKTRFEANEKR